MNNLFNSQNKFQNYLLHGHEEFQKLIVSTVKVPAEIRLAIYSNAYRSRLVEALESNYPNLSAYVGDEIFEQMANDYLDQHPSRFRSIRWFGDQFAHFLNVHNEYKDYPYLSELAKFEWTQTLVFDAADSTVIKIEEIAKISPEHWNNMRFDFHPSVHRLNLSWNVVQIWQAISDNQSPDEPVQQPAVPWMLWRRELVNQFCSLSESEAWAMDAIRNKSIFGEICEGLCKWVDKQEAAMQAASLLKGWIQAGLLSTVTY